MYIRFMSVLFLAFLYVVAPTFAQSNMVNRPKIALYVVDGRGNIGEAIATNMLEAFVNSGRYLAIERSYAFIQQIENELEIQQSGAVDEAQISRIGKQYGVDFICVVNVTRVLGEYQLSARLINVETARVVQMATAVSLLANMTDLRRASNVLIEKFLGINVIGSSPPDPPPPPTNKSNIKYGVQTGINYGWLEVQTVGTFGGRITWAPPGTYGDEDGRGCGKDGTERCGESTSRGALGYQIGVSMDIPLNIWDLSFSINPKILFVSKGGTLTWPVWGGYTTYTIEAYYLDVFLPISYTTWDELWRFEIGPSFSFGLFGEQKIEIGQTGHERELKQSAFDEGLERFDVGLIITSALQFSSYSISFITNIDCWGNSFANTFYLTFGYIF